MDWKLLKNRCRESVQCDDSDSEDAFEPDAVTVDRAGSEQSRTDHGENAVNTRCQQIEYANLGMDKSSPEQTATQSKTNVCREQNIPNQTVMVTVKKDMRPVTAPEGK